jgi:hypothetical protein
MIHSLKNIPALVNDVPVRYKRNCYLTKCKRIYIKEIVPSFLPVYFIFETTRQMPNKVTVKFGTKFSSNNLVNYIL